jgi:hypothetical protein
MASFFLKYAESCILEIMTGRGKLATKAAKSALKDQTCWESTHYSFVLPSSPWIAPIATISQHENGFEFHGDLRRPLRKPLFSREMPSLEWSLSWRGAAPGDLLRTRQSSPMSIPFPCLRPSLRVLAKHRAAVDGAGEIAVEVATTSALQCEERAIADGAVGLQPAFPVVRGLECGRRSAGRDGVHKNREWLLGGEITEGFFEQVIEQAQGSSWSVRLCGMTGPDGNKSWRLSIRLQ